MGLSGVRGMERGTALNSGAHFGFWPLRFMVRWLASEGVGSHTGDCMEELEVRTTAFAARTKVMVLCCYT
jgi:hypothetical protein